MSKKKVLIVDDDRLIRWSLQQKLTAWDYDVSASETAADGLRRVAEESPDLVLLDMRLPDGKGVDVLAEIRKSWPELPVIMITAFGLIEDAVAAMRHGAYDFVTKPFEDPKLQSAIGHALEATALRKKIAAFREMEKTTLIPGPIVGRTPTMLSLLDMVRTIAESETSIILLQGDSGTGKDLVAQTIHSWSRRREAPFLAINCSAIPGNLLESELFGYEKGAFTDAKQQKRGLVELADEGTLFLDEISSLDLALQAKLLRFLETSSFKRVGGLRDVEVDLRIIAATNQDLERMCREEKFRKDLFYRLNVCPVRLPTLAERRDDILPLAAHFIGLYNQRFNKAIRGLDPEAERLVLGYGWPGNVRELKNAIERAMIFEVGPMITARHLPIRPGNAGASPAAPLTPGAIPEEGMTLPEAENKLIRQALEKAGGNISQSARLLGISRDTLRYKLKKMGKG